MKFLKITTVLLCLTAAAFASGAFADGTNTGDASSSSERNALLALLNEQTEIATKTKLNADYVPGIVTVLRGDDLEARGYRTVWEALALVPGVNPFIDKLGHKRLVIRGISDTLYSGNVKIMLNDVAVNATKDSMADPVLNLPISQIARIEVIRGPGSVVHGEYAYSGVINVVSRKEGKAAYVSTGSDSALGAGMLWSGAWGNDWHGSVNLAARQTSGNRQKTGTDALYNTTPSLAANSNAPGPANTKEENDSAIFNLTHDNFSLLAQWSSYAAGDYFGVNYILPPAQNRLVTLNSYGAISVKQGLTPVTGLRIDLALGWRKSDENYDRAYLGPPQAFGASTGNDVVMDSAYSESRLNGGVDIHWNGWAQHKVLFALSHSEVKVDASWQRANLDPSTYQYSATMNTLPTLITSGTQRIINATMAQDEYRYSDLFTLTTGLRYDQYSDAGSRLTPRVAGVWRLDEHHILKAQYAQAFRPPTFVETKLGNGTTKASDIDTYELGYILKAEQFETRANAYYSSLSNLITYNGALGKYVNANHARTAGVELEHTQAITTSLSADGSIAYADTRDSTTGIPIPGSAKWLGNLGLTAHLGDDTTAQFQYRYVSDRARETSDPRSALPGYQTLDATLTMHNLVYRGLSLRGSIQNLFDASIRYPALMTTGSNPTPIVSYFDDLPGPGRTWWLQLSYKY